MLEVCYISISAGETLFTFTYESGELCSYCHMKSYYFQLFSCVNNSDEDALLFQCFCNMDVGVREYYDRFTILFSTPVLVGFNLE